METKIATDPETDGLSCVVCEGDEPTIPVGRSETGALVFACASCCGEADPR